MLFTFIFSYCLPSKYIHAHGTHVGTRWDVLWGSNGNSVWVPLDFFSGARMGTTWDTSGFPYKSHIGPMRNPQTKPHGAHIGFPWEYMGYLLGLHDIFLL